MYEFGGMDEYCCLGLGFGWWLVMSCYSCLFRVRYDDNNDDDMKIYEKNF